MPKITATACLILIMMIAALTALVACGEKTRPNNLLINASFDQWSAGQPVGWKVESGKVTQVYGLSPTNAALQIENDPKNSGAAVIVQTFDADKLAGHVLRAAIGAQSGKPQEFSLRIRTHQDKKNIGFYKVMHPGLGEYRDLVVKVELPRNLPAHTKLDFSLRLEKKAAGPVVVDDAELTVEK